MLLKDFDLLKRKLSKATEMIICIAGKNEIAIDTTIFIKKHFPTLKVFGIVTEADKGINTCHRSFKSFLKINEIQQITLEEAYTIKELIFISLQFDKIVIPSKFLSKKLFNLHFSFLPSYKGMYPSVWPILNFEEYGGVTLHEIDRGIDTGDIIKKSRIKIDKQETVNTLYRKYLSEGTHLVQQNFQALIENSYSKNKQSVVGSTYYSYKSIDYKNLALDLNTTSAQIDAQIRAFTYRQYQLLNVYNTKIVSASFTDEKSSQKAGKLIFEDEFTIKISTIDFNIILYKDNFEKFIEACKSDNIELIKKLLHYVNLEDKTKEGWTPLAVACFNNSTNTIPYLLANGADVNAINNNGTTVVMFAKDGSLNSGSLEALNLVLRFNPNIYQIDFFNKNIFDYLGVENQKVAKYIKEYTYDKIP